MALELYSVIKNDGPADVLYWKFQGEDFRTGSQLIVAESEEALFVRDGVIYETFTGGKFTLTTNNYPFIDKIRAFFSGGVNSFNCKVYFVNKADLLELKWGTDSPIALRDPVWGISTKIQGRGSYTVKVKDSKKFVLKFVGNNAQIVTPDFIRQQFRSAVNQKIKTLIGKSVLSSGLEILTTIADLEAFADAMRPGFAEVLDEYGIELVNLFISALEIPDGDPGRAKLEDKLAEAAADDAQIRKLGNNWQRVQGRNIMMTMAGNEGTAGSVAGMGAGMGMGMAAGGAFGALANSVFAPFANQQQPPVPSASAPSVSRFAPKSSPSASDASFECPSCHAKLSGAMKFCPECGTKIEAKQAFCTSCGAQLSPGAKFCGECGAKQ